MYPFKHKTFQRLKFYTAKFGPGLVVLISTLGAILEQNAGISASWLLTAAAILGALNIFLKSLIDESSRVFYEQKNNTENQETE